MPSASRHTGRVSSPFIYFAGDALSLAEKSAARLDGDLIELDEAYTPTDTVETAAMRAGSLASLLGDTLAATHLSAAWIYGLLPDPPRRHTVQRAVPRRIHGVLHPRLHYRDLQVPPDDLLLLAGVRVTTPGRTVADLARVADVAHGAALDAYAVQQPRAVAAGLHWLEAAGTVPHKRAAVALLRSYPLAVEV